MYYTGIDLHGKTSFFTTINKDVEIVKRANLQNQEKAIIGYLSLLEEQSQIVIESTANWYWLYDRLNDHGIKVVISNPVKTKSIASARIKNDKLDSRTCWPSCSGRI